MPTRLPARSRSWVPAFARTLSVSALGAATAVAGATVLELRRRAGADDDTARTTDLPRAVTARMTTPLLPDDYLHLINPLWTARELRGQVVEVRPETEDAATLVIRPGWGWHVRHQAGQYVGIGVNLDGRWHWRSYSISAPSQQGGQISITVKAMPEGFLSTHLVRGLKPGAIVRLALPQGDFVLSEPPPAKVLFWTGGSGITPIMAMLRTLDRRATMPDVVHVHSAPTESAFIFRTELRELSERAPNYRLCENLNDRDGVFDVDRLTREVPDWRDRQAWVCGPAPMLDAAEKHWGSARLSSALHLERFGLQRSQLGEGGHVVFATSGREDDVDGATTLLEAGEKLGVKMPFGCRMGICHTCVVPLRRGTVRDLRSGEEYQQNQGVQTCVTAAAGDCELAI